MHMTRALAAVSAVALLAGCYNPLLSQADRRLVCRVAVDDKSSGPRLRPNVYSSPAGGLAGAATGAGIGLSGGILAFLLVPIGAVIGGGAGAACAAGGLAHPTADEDFRRWLQEVGTGSIPRAISARLDAPRAGCGAIEGPRPQAPDAILEIRRVEVGMGCFVGALTYTIAVDWRTTAAGTRNGTGRMLNDTRTECQVSSALDAAGWFAKPDRARREIDRALARTGERIAMQLLAQDTLRACKLHADERGEVDFAP